MSLLLVGQTWKTFGSELSAISGKRAWILWFRWNVIWMDAVGVAVETRPPK